MEPKIIIVLSSEDGSSIAVGPFIDKETAEIFAENVSRLPDQTLQWELEVLIDPEEYMDGE